MADIPQALSPLARLKLQAQLMGLARQMQALAPGDRLKKVRIGAQISAIVQQLGGFMVSQSAAAPAAPPASPAEARGTELEGGPEPIEQPRVVTAKFYDFDPNRKHSERKKDNSAAMALLRQIDAGELQPPLTDAQKEVLARYSGTGGNLVGADGLKGSAYEYYTPKPIAAGMWGLLGEMGFKGGKVGDPCAGVGIFGATAPASAAMDTVELDGTSGRVNQLVNGGPGYSATISPFEAVASRTPDEIWDAVITNVPFGGVHDRGANRKLDPKYSDQPLETYFILRSLEKLKPGGLAAFIVPPRIVSAKGGREEKLRIAMSYMAEFLGAYRLPNSVFGTADADTITDVIVLRKYSRSALTKIEELKELNPAALVEAKVQWTEFIGGVYFQGEGKRFVLGEFQAKDPNKFRDVDRVVSDQSVANIAKLLRRFPGSRVDWAMLESLETEPIVYADGDTITMAGRTLQMRDGAWVDLGQAPESERFDPLGQKLTSAAVAVTNGIDWAQANDFVLYLRGRSMEMDMPTWLRMAHRDILKLDDGDRAAYWQALASGLAAIEVTQRHGGEGPFNYLEEYPAISRALAASCTTAKKGAAVLSRESKAALQKVGIVYTKRDGYSGLWRGEGAARMEVADLDEDAQVERIKYETQGLSIDVAKLRSIYGERFDPLADDGWCLNADGTKATKADDYYVGNLGDFLARIDAEIAQAQPPLRDKLLRQREMAMERVARVDPSSLRFNLFSPFATMEEKAEFLRRFLHPAFVVAYDDDGEKVIRCDIGSPKTERERQLKRFAEYLKKGNLSTRTNKDEAKMVPGLDAQRRAMLREMVVQTNAQFDQWAKSNPLIMERLRERSNDPAKLYFIETEDTGALQIEGLHPDFKPHGYQRAFVRKMGRSFSGINGFDVGLGKTATALASVLYVQSIGVKRKTIFVVPNTVLSNWRKEALIGNAQPGHPQYRPPVFGADVGPRCLFVGLDFGRDGKPRVDPANYARDLNKVMENKHSMVFCTLEAFKLIPLKDDTIARYQQYLGGVDPSYDGGDRKADSERAESKVTEATTGTGEKSNAVPFFEDMGFDSMVGDELHLYKNSKDTVEFSGAKFLSVAEASQRGLDVQIKAWFLRGLSPLNDGVLGLTATPITNSPLEIYSMLCLALGEERVHDLVLGAKGADEFMEVMCNIEEDEEPGIDGEVKTYRVFRGLQNVDLLRNAIATAMTIKTAADVKEAGDDLKLPEAPQNDTKVKLTPQADGLLNLYKLAYRAARKELKPNGDPATPEELQALGAISEKFGEPVELIAHPFNLINKMTLLIADPELDERATFYDFAQTQADTAQAAVASFNKLGKIEARSLPGPWTDAGAVVGSKIVRDGDSEVSLVKIKVQAKIAKGRIVIDTMDTNLQAEFERIADKAGLDLDCSVPPKLAALLENVRAEEANPRSQSGRVKQIIFCDVLPLHNKIKRLLVKRAGIPASAIVVVSGQTIKNAEQMQGVQDGFNAEGEENRYRIVIANEKAEVGINLQKGTQAIHHLTIGWTPDSTIQRNGRGVRQGNTTAVVNIYNYDANGTFDEYKRTLTSKKSDWIGAVMDKQGGNDVAIQGGLTAEEYDDMINAVGDDAAMAAVRERAALKEQTARAESARARQVVNFKTVGAHQEFVKRYPSAKEWITDKALQLYDLRISLSSMKARTTNPKLSARSLITLETRIAELEARIAGLIRDLGESATFTSYIGGRQQPVSIEEVLSKKSHYSTAAKIREQFESDVKYGMQVKDGSTLAQDWQAETAASAAMAEEAIKDFERLAKTQPGTYSLAVLSAVREGTGTTIDGRLIVQGQFIRADGKLLVVSRENRAILLTLDGESRPQVAKSYSISDAVNMKGAQVIAVGSPEHEQALKEAAAFDDAVADGLTADAIARLFTTQAPDVAKYRTKKTLVRYSTDDLRMPSPMFRYVIDPKAPGISAPMQAIVAAQAGIIADWQRSDYGYLYALIPSDVDVTFSRTYGEGSAERCKALIAYARANSVRMTMDDFQAVLGTSRSTTRITADTIGALVKWPDVTDDLNAVADFEALDALGRRTAEQAIDFAVLGEGDLIEEWALFRLKAQFNARRLQIKMAMERAAAGQQDPAPTPAATATAEVNADVAALIARYAGVAPDRFGRVAIKGETRPHKETIKAAARLAKTSGFAKWNGDKAQWEVPAETWEYLVRNHPDAARVLQVVPV